MHWFDELLPKVKEHLGSKPQVIISSGLSVSGLQHVGRLRGEVLLSHLIATALRGEGRTVDQKIVLYTQDPWKASPRQQAEFRDGSGGRYAGWRLEDVPDPHGDHRNWVEHYWQDFGGNLPRFAPGVEVFSTTEAYRLPEMKALIRDLASRRDEVRAVVNKYRERKPYPEGWIPFEPRCEQCRRVGKAAATAIDGDFVEYECECGHRGKSSLEVGKLNWRLEWPALWKVLHVDIEPFGKDHATPGGSRDSCREIARAVMGFEPPFGIPYEWVAYGENGVDRGDMDSSDFKGFGPGAWLAVGAPEVLRFLFTVNPIVRRVVLDLSKVDAYHDQYDAARGLFYGKPATDDGAHHRRAWELAQLASPPKEAPWILRYRHAAYLAQIAPGEGDAVPWVERRLRETGILPRELTAAERGELRVRLQLARTWVERHSPENRVVLLESLNGGVLAKLDDQDRQALAAFAAKVQDSSWGEEAIKEAMVALTRSDSLPVDTPRFFRDLYLALLGHEKGPRAAPFLAVLEKSWVLRRLEETAR